jgi:hypothetical protein
MKGKPVTAAFFAKTRGKRIANSRGLRVKEKTDPPKVAKRLYFK